MEISKDDAERLLNWFGTWERTAKEIDSEAVTAEDRDLFERLLAHTDPVEEAPS